MTGTRPVADSPLLFDDDPEYEDFEAMPGHDEVERQPVKRKLF